MPISDLTFSRDTTVGSLLDEAKHYNAGLVKIIQEERGKPVGAVVVLRGGDTKAYLQALERAESLLDEDSELIED